jgi:hypothetical protein
VRKPKVFKSGLKPGDNVNMIDCFEAQKYKDRIWKVMSEPWDLCGSEVVKLKDKPGGFATRCLKKVAMEASK